MSIAPEIEYGVIFDEHRLISDGTIEARVRLYFAEGPSHPECVEIVSRVSPVYDETTGSLHRRLVMKAAGLFRQAELKEQVHFHQACPGLSVA